MTILEQETKRHRSRSITITVPKIGTREYERNDDGEYKWVSPMEGEISASLHFWRVLAPEGITMKEYYHQDGSYDLESETMEEVTHFLTIDGQDLIESEYWVERFMENIAPRIEDRVVIETRTETKEVEREILVPRDVIIMGDGLIETLDNGVTVTITSIDLEWGKVRIEVGLPYDEEDASLLEGEEVDKALRLLHDRIVGPLRLMETWDPEVHTVACKSTLSASSTRVCDTNFLGPSFD